MIAADSAMLGREANGSARRLQAISRQSKVANALQQTSRWLVSDYRAGPNDKSTGRHAMAAARLRAQFALMP